MKYRIPVLLILLLALPLMVLAWLGQRTLQQERVVTEHQAQRLAESRLREAQTLIHGFINELQQSSVAAVSFLQQNKDLNERDIQSIRQAVGADPFLTQLFVLDGENILLFPLDSAAHSNSERAFSQSLRPLLEDDNTFRAKVPRERAAQPSLRARYPANKASSSIDRAANIQRAIRNQKQKIDAADRAQTGWTSWDAGTATDIYLWHRNEQELLIGQKLSSAYWLSQLIARLPSGSDAGSLTNAAIRLVDKRQRTIYQWGGYLFDAEATVQAKEWLTYPLDGWRLEYYSPPHAGSGFQSLLFIASFLSLALLLAIGGWLMWREYRRDIRDAEQRISFVNQVSHELKTPLTNICIYADMLEAEVTQKDQPDTSRVKKFSDVVTSESQRLGRLINNVLNFSRAQQQKITVHKQANNVDDVINGTLEHFRAAFDKKGIEIQAHLNSPNSVMLDAELLEQVLNNLLSNIEKYAADGKLASITSEQHDQRITILVHDAGTGVSGALKRKIFEPFERGSNSLTDGVAGTGIGLSIARDLCRLHGGELELIDSEQGACFKITLATEAVE